ncbi:MAG: NYN domain-containing protein [Lachnospiraceae bacterium]|nr:NYN domain-containing protein [Lachnospiraceae bacterium]
MKKVAVYIDGENIPAKEASKIFYTAQRIGGMVSAKVYGIQKDPGTKGWSEEASRRAGLKDIRLCGGPGRNKVDKKIQKDIAKDPDCADVIILATSDHGYAECVRDARNKGKKVIGIGRQKTKKLMEVCDAYIRLGD